MRTRAKAASSAPAKAAYPSMAGALAIKTYMTDLLLSSQALAERLHIGVALGDIQWSKKGSTVQLHLTVLPPKSMPQLLQPALPAPKAAAKKVKRKKPRRPLLKRK